MQERRSLVIIACIGLLFPLLGSSAAHAGACENAPYISVDSDVEAGDVSIAYNANCSGADLIQIKRGTRFLSTVFEQPSPANGWRYTNDYGVEPGKSYCYRATTKRDGVSKSSSMTCVTIPDPVLALDQPSEALHYCSNVSTPSSIEAREHIYITTALAAVLGIDPADVTDDGPSPQVRLIVESPTLSNGLQSTANYTVAGLCDYYRAYDWDMWVWDDDRLALPASASQATVRVEAVAPSRTTIHATGQTQVQNHFTEPNSGSKYFHEEVTLSSDKRVALLVPHGGGIERNTSAQIAPFVTALGTVQANVWDNQGQWGNGETVARWHITAGDIHPDGFPGLDRLTSEPLFDAAAGRAFQYAVALHGYEDGSTNAGLGIILGGLADRDVLCHVARRIRDEASRVQDLDQNPADRSDAIGFHIANAGANGQDLVIANGDGYFPPTSKAKDLEGTSTSNIVNWLSAGDTDGDQVPDVWGSIQLEQSRCLRREMDCPSLTNGSFCTGTGAQAACLHNIVARGVARAVAELVDTTTPFDPVGSCCGQFGSCP